MLAFTGFLPRDLLEKYGISKERDVAFCPSILFDLMHPELRTMEKDDPRRKELEKLKPHCSKCGICPYGRKHVVFPLH